MIFISHPACDFIVSATIMEDYIYEKQSVAWSLALSLYKDFLT